MELQPGKSPARKVINVVHKKNVLVFDSGELQLPAPGKVDFDKVVGVVNQYWATLSENEQDELFETYEAINDIIYNSVGQLNIELRPYLMKLGELHNFERVYTWMQSARPVKVPNDLKVEYDSDAPDNNRTYLRKDYEDLLALTVMVKAMMPVFSAYISQSTELLKTAFKEQWTFSLVSGTEFTRNRAIDRLLRYVEAYSETDDIDLAFIMGGMSRQSIPARLLALAIIRRLTKIELEPTRSVQPASNIIVNIYNYLKHKTSKAEASLNNGQTICNKKTDRNDGLEDNMSRNESVKCREEIDKGTIIRYGVFLDNAMEPEIGIYHLLDHTAPLDLLATCQATFRRKTNLTADSFRVKIVQYAILGYRVMNPCQRIADEWLAHGVAKMHNGELMSMIFPATVVNLLELPMRINLFAVAQALLIHWGFPHLAALLSVDAKLPQTGNVISARGFTVNPVERELIDRAIELYPYLSITPGQREQIENARQNAERSEKDANILRRLLISRNPVNIEVQDLYERLSSLTWTGPMPRQVMSTHGFRVINEQLALNEDVKNDLFRIILRGKRK